jgi:hypothetical protein
MNSGNSGNIGCIVETATVGIQKAGIRGKLHKKMTAAPSHPSIGACWFTEEMECSRSGGGNGILRVGSKKGERANCTALYFFQKDREAQQL